MPRRAAAHRFDDLTPTGQPGSGEELAGRIAALANPARRLLWEHLCLDGPAPVGRLARATGMAVGSASHHLRVLARAGFCEPVPELANDTRESWWRALPGTSRWSSEAFASGSPGERLARLGTTANVEHLLTAVRRWIAAPPVDDDPWQATVADTLVYATPEQLDELGAQLANLLTAFTRECREGQESAPDAPRRPVRVIALAFPEASHG